MAPQHTPDLVCDNTDSLSMTIIDSDNDNFIKVNTCKQDKYCIDTKATLEALNYWRAAGLMTTACIL